VSVCRLLESASSPLEATAMRRHAGGVVDLRTRGESPSRDEGRVAIAEAQFAQQPDAGPSRSGVRHDDFTLWKFETFGER
jgi:hypothetical protein